MRDLAIHAEGLGKQYRVGRLKEPYGTLRDAVANAAAGWARAAARAVRRGDRAPAAERFWALKDVNLEVQQGEVLGIVGRNGVGKSTLLRILSRITDPTTGWADIRGRIGSLLEVGTGFHPELTGRENIQLNGAILGMRRAEIMRKLDEIVAFAEVDRFVDTPVKHYSSGMYLRLAFAVAAHLEPEILLVDEVLAVGDARFQRKCMDKMQDVGERGCTVLFVSHNMPAVTRLCGRAVLLDGGRVTHDGTARHVVSAYLSSDHGLTSVREWKDPATAPATEVVRLHAIRVKTEDGQTVRDTVDIRQPLGVEIEYEVLKPGHVLQVIFGIRNTESDEVLDALDQDPEWRGRPRPQGRYVSTGWIPGNFLAEGMLFIEPFIRPIDSSTQYCYAKYAVAIQVVDCPNADTARGDYPDRLSGGVRPLLKWTTERCSAVSGTPALGVKGTTCV